MDLLTSVFPIEPQQHYILQQQDIRNREPRCWSCANDRKGCMIEKHADDQLGCLRCRKLKRNCSNEAPEPSSKRISSRLKCAECRRRKQKCIFRRGPWPMKCEQCEAHNFECSEPREPSSGILTKRLGDTTPGSPTKRLRGMTQEPPSTLSSDEGGPDATVCAELLLELHEPKPDSPRLLLRMASPKSHASPNADISRNIGHAAKDTGFAANSPRFNVVSITNKWSNCFRITNVPSAWSEGDLVVALQTIDPFFKDSNYSISLYPACYDFSQTALLSLDACTEYFQSLGPNESKYLQNSDGTPIMVDSHFHDLTPLNTPGDTVVADVIAVTGLAGHAFGSWRSRETCQMWLQDFLPKAVKNIRIMTYGYHSHLTGYEEGGTTLSGCARGLIEQLENSRRLAKDRPIIFIGHSLGGLIIKQALVQARGSYLHKSILDATRAIFFFGTPRTGELKEVVNVDASGRESNLIMQLKEGSESLAKQQEDLLCIWEFKQKVVIFSETEKTPLIRKLASGEPGQLYQTFQRFVGQPFEHWIPVNKTYKDSVQFASPVDTTYLTVVKHMRECIAQSSAQKILWSAIENIDPDQFLQLLSPIDQEKHKSTLQTSGRDHPKFSWIFKNMDFEQWRSGNSQVLWLTGPPECGIHQAPSHIVDLIRSEDSEKQPIVLYFFCSTASGAKSVAAAFIYALLRQVANYLSPLKRKSFITAFLSVLLDALISKDSNIDADFWRLKKDCSPELTIRKILDELSGNDHWHSIAIKQLLQIGQAQGLTIIIDGLDEARDQKTDFIKEICSLIAYLKKQTYKFKVLLTSQPQTEIKVFLEDLPCIEYDVERKECLNALRFNNTRYSKISKAHQGTLEWLWTHTQYQEWSESSNSSLLYIEGKPGSGKSTLAKYFRDHILQREPDANVASFFYSYREGEHHTSHYSMLRAILYDILNQNESFFFHFQRDYRKHQALTQERCEWPYWSLKKVLLSLGEHRRSGRLYLIIDAVDESNNQDRRDILQLLFELCSKKSVKIFVTSRPVIELGNCSKGSHQVIKMQDENEPDIRNFVDSFIPVIGFPEGALRQARQYIIEHSQGVFLWVRLVKDTLYNYAEVGCTKSEIFNFLRSLPRELKGLYEHIIGGLELADERDVTLGTRMFRFILFACRPLTVLELQHALAIPDDPDTEFIPSVESFEDNQIFGMEKRITRCGGNLIEIKGRGGTASVQFMHQTAREFLLQSHSFTGASRLSMNESDAHMRIAMTCIRYLILCAGNSTSYGTLFRAVETWKWEMYEAYVRYLDDRPFIGYALSYFKNHLSRCSEATNLSGVISQLAGELAPGSSQYYLLENWITPYLNKSPPSRKMAEAAQEFRNQVLLAAVKTRRYRVVKMLLTAGAQLENFQQVIPPSVRSVPHAAVEHKHKATIKLLLDRSASIQTRDPAEGWTLLHLAARYGCESTIKLLLKESACTESQDKDNSGTAPLNLGVKSEHEAIIQLLLDHCVEVNTQDNECTTALRWAAEQRYETIVRLLLDHDISIEAGDSDDGSTALHRAVERESGTTMVSDGADMRARDSNDSQTALSRPTEREHDVTVHLLSDHLHHA